MMQTKKPSPASVLALTLFSTIFAMFSLGASYVQHQRLLLFASLALMTFNLVVLVKSFISFLKARSNKEEG